MTELILFITIPLTFVGGIIAAFQLGRIWVQLGTPFQGNLGNIIIEHLLGGAIWIVFLMAWAFMGQHEIMGELLHNIFTSVLSISIILLVWVFALRTHLWYRNNPERLE